jgi:hydrogenase expression/formation protein HypE
MTALGAPAERILLGHGGGGSLMQQLIDAELRSLYPDPAAPLHDAARLELPHGRLAFSTDGYVVHPLEFPGGDIGRLAVVGTCNDLAMAGARPLQLSLALILEEGLELALLRRILASVRAAAHECGVQVVTGDTKVVERGKGDGAFLTTTGIGLLTQQQPIGPEAIQAGDQLVLSGDLGRHGIAILAARHGLELSPPLLSDCAPLWPLVEALLARGVRPHCLRDLTRGGLASALHELATAAGLEFHLQEGQIPVAVAVARCAELLGLDPLHLANEGRLVAVVARSDLAATLELLEPLGGAWIGSVVATASDPLAPGPAAIGPPTSGPAAPSPYQLPRVILATAFGSQRLLVPLSGELLPRIC